MKKKVFLLLALMSSISAYAYDYDKSSGSGFMTFIGIILLAWGVLEIILFFKIWKMTDNVNALKRSLVDADSTAGSVGSTLAQLKKSVKQKYLLGQTNEAYEEIGKFAYKKIARLEGCTLQQNEKGEQVAWLSVSGQQQQVNPDVFIQAVLNEVKPIYEAIGREVPERLQKLTYSEFISFAKS